MKRWAEREVVDVRKLFVHALDEVVLDDRDRQRASGSIAPDDIVLLGIRPFE
jgi:hypothetical protein